MSHRESGRIHMTHIHRLPVLALFLVFGLLGLVMAGCGENNWSIDRVRASSHLHSIPITPGLNGHKAFADAVRNDLPKGTPLAAVRRYIQEHFVDDGHLIVTDTTTGNKTDHPWPPRVRLRISEGGARFAGNHYSDLAFYFDDDGLLSDADAYYYSSHF